MKYIKHFEDINLKYKVNTYIILDIDGIEERYKDNEFYVSPNDNIAIITGIKNIQHEDYYTVEFFHGVNDSFYFVQDIDILREAAEEEIKHFKLKKEAYLTADKYNI